MIIVLEIEASSQISILMITKESPGYDIHDTSECNVCVKTLAVKPMSHI